MKLELAPKEPSKKDQKEADKLGGSEPREPYVRRDQTPDYDRGGHAERSKANDPRPDGHRKH
jgi:hypothetical protein